MCALQCSPCEIIVVITQLLMVLGKDEILLLSNYLSCSAKSNVSLYAYLLTKYCVKMLLGKCFLMRYVFLFFYPTKGFCVNMKFALTDIHVHITFQNVFSKVVLKEKHRQKLFWLLCEINSECLQQPKTHPCMNFLSSSYLDFQTQFVSGGSGGAR